MGIPIRWTVDTRASKRLRFDDPEFVEAYTSGEGNEYWAAIDSALRAGTTPSDVDWSYYADAGIFLQARAGIKGAEQDAMTNAAQTDVTTKGYQVNMEVFNREWLALWILQVGAQDEDAAAAIPPDLSSPKRSARAAAWADVPSEVRQAMMARLAVHVKYTERPPDRDPKVETSAG